MSPSRLNKRGLLIVFLTLVHAALIVIGWSIGPPRVDTEVMRSIAASLGYVVGAAVVAVGGISATDWKEAHVEQVKSAPAPTVVVG